MEILSFEEKKRIVDETIEKYMKYLNPGLARLYKFANLATVEWRGEGAKVFDIFGEAYIDCIGGFGVFNVGRNHPRVVAKVIEQLQLLPLSSRTLFNKHQADLAEMLAQITPGDLQYSFFCNSGAEAVEGALKLARMYTKRKKFVSAIGGFHGKTFGALSVSGREVYKKPFEPLLPGTEQVPFGDLEAMEKAVDEDTAAVILEPIQGEGGVILPPSGYLQGVREICTERGALLILDEVQTGLGRTGKMFACEHYGVVPDIMTLAKGLGGGVLPLGAFVSTAEIWQVFEENPLIHSSTFGGNPLSCVAGIETLKILKEENIPAQVAEKGKYLLERLKVLQGEFPEIVREVRGLGLLIGMELFAEDAASLLAMEMAQRKVLVVYTLNNPKVIRLEPPLTITYEEMDAVLSALYDSLREVRAIVQEIGG
ncbi:aspartate aminotransferase family protein [Candidatus Caldatribacterium sp.]|uniref:aspartate aminotransferase family protein n=1 Tax=Candidatus Caldatribacterium sp. TaxID=2282143 RepID=UPI00299A8C52|nr:aminotransferase class III-fold pyridoxal phosphate-dependent enzyme [Candidatus Caldatribacterium sp.]MDW8080589.1 aminotransferase class III-fold pyridoxal phosphate-dependent enzyme [Candidatus Calescibacterium sp.]